MRGEEIPLCLCATHPKELPPHARRRAEFDPFDAIAIGITSACAEKRTGDKSHRRISGNYLRMRGEEAGVFESSRERMELPPHARRRGSKDHGDGVLVGITSACAEKSTFH